MEKHFRRIEVFSAGLEDAINDLFNSGWAGVEYEALDERVRSVEIHQGVATRHLQTKVNALISKGLTITDQTLVEDPLGVKAPTYTIVGSMLDTLYEVTASAECEE